MPVPPWGEEPARELWGEPASVEVRESKKGSCAGDCRAVTTGFLVDLDAMMDLALREARIGAERGEVPVGAVVVLDDAVVASAHNERETAADPTAHAELLAIVRASRALGRWRLVDTTLVVTLEPCAMCAGALVNARVARLVYGASDPKAGAVRSLFRIADDPRLNHRLEIVGGVRAEESAALLTDFFLARRGKAF